MLPEEGIRVPELTAAETADGLVIYGVDPATGMDFKIPFALFEKVANEAKALAGQAKEASDTANNQLSRKLESSQYSETDYPEIEIV